MSSSSENVFGFLALPKNAYIHAFVGWRSDNILCLNDVWLVPTEQVSKFRPFFAQEVRIFCEKLGLGIVIFESSDPRGDAEPGSAELFLEGSWRAVSREILIVWASQESATGAQKSFFLQHKNHQTTIPGNPFWVPKLS